MITISIIMTLLFLIYGTAMILVSRSMNKKCKSPQVSVKKFNIEVEKALALDDEIIENLIPTV